MFETLFNLFRSVENIMNRRLTRVGRRFVHRGISVNLQMIELKGIIAARKISTVAFLRNDAWNVRCNASPVEIGYVVPLRYKNNIFWILKTAISRNYEKWMATCGMSVLLKL